MVIAMTVIKSASVLRSVLIAGWIAGVGAGVADDKKQEALKVTLEELAKEPEKYQGKLIQVEAVIQETQIPKVKRGEYDYRLVVGKDNFMVWCVGKLEVRKGDTVRITGEFSYISEGAANPYRILAGSKSGKVEKVVPKKPE